MRAHLLSVPSRPDGFDYHFPGPTARLGRRQQLPNCDILAHILFAWHKRAAAVPCMIDHVHQRNKHAHAHTAFLCGAAKRPRVHQLAEWQGCTWRLSGARTTAASSLAVSERLSWPGL